jgi:hypothetical protein
VDGDVDQGGAGGDVRETPSRAGEAAHGGGQGVGGVAPGHTHAAEADGFVEAGGGAAGDPEHLGGVRGQEKVPVTSRTVQPSQRDGWAHSSGPRSLRRVARAVRWVSIARHRSPATINI